jgi:hypothetical protein
MPNPNITIRTFSIAVPQSFATLRLRRDSTIDTQRGVLLLHVFGDISDITLSLSNDAGAGSKWLRLSDLNMHPATKGKTNLAGDRFAALRLPLRNFGTWKEWNHVILQTRELTVARSPYYVMVGARISALVPPGVSCAGERTSSLFQRKHAYRALAYKVARQSADSPTNSACMLFGDGCAT